MENKRYFNHDSMEIVTTSELLDDWMYDDTLQADFPNFDNYLRACLWHNGGMLDEITDKPGADITTAQIKAFKDRLADTAIYAKRLANLQAQADDVERRSELTLKLNEVLSRQDEIERCLKILGYHVYIAPMPGTEAVTVVIY